VFNNALEMTQLGSIYEQKLLINCALSTSRNT